MSAELQGLNAGYVAQLLEDYLDEPASVPPEWRALFERDAACSGASGLRRLLEARRRKGTGTRSRAAAPAPPTPEAPPPALPSRSEPLGAARVRRRPSHPVD